MVLPVDWGGQQFYLLNKSMFVQDPVRRAIYFNGLAPVVETPVTETTMFETLSADVFNAPEDEEKTKTPGGQTISNSRSKTTGKWF